jgi:Protein of unknown function (DUF4245)
LKKSFADMVRSLGLMAVIVAAMLFIGARYLIMPGSAERPPPADYSSVVQDFPRAAGAAVLAPTSLPSSWRANAARLTTGSAGVTQLHIGWALPGSRYAGLDEATGSPATLLSAVLGTPRLTVRGTTSIAGAVWQQRVSARGERAYTRQDGRVTVVVTGDASDEQLRLLAASLHHA